MITTLLEIDLQNLFYGARNKGGKRLDFEKIINYFNSRETEYLTESLVYMIRSKSFDSSKFEVKMKSLGYTLKIKNTIKAVKKGYTTYRQANQDVPIVVDCMNKIDSFDKFILMSGDGDFAYLCKDLRKKGKQVEIWSFKDSYNQMLSPHADKVNFLEDKSFFYKKPRISVFGLNFGELR